MPIFSAKTFFVAVPAGLATGPHPSPSTVLLTTALAGSLVLQFRLWDDLADLPEDRRRHPDRVLGRTRTTRPFWGLLAATAALNVGLVATWPLAARAGSRRKSDARISAQWRLFYLSAADFGANNSA